MRHILIRCPPDSGNTAATVQAKWKKGEVHQTSETSEGEKKMQLKI
jgi:hypothetical protein